MGLNQTLIYSLIHDIRYADVITIRDSKVHSVKITTVLKEDEGVIEFHIPNRCQEIKSALDDGEEILLKFNTEYTEVSANWHSETPKDKRISTIIGIEIHIRTQPTLLTKSELINHLKDTTKQSKDRISDTFTIDQLDEDYFQDTIQGTTAYKIKISAKNTSTVENIIDYRSEKDKLSTIQKLRELSLKNPENKFSKSAEIIEKINKF